ncbi:MAG: histidinol dehydrogenase [Spirochaetaceae bacterium]|jgi:histidinol dehydrogenase|nr:histidinol dehydrogenase [Spirochaetaceae bacterium]
MEIIRHGDFDRYWQRQADKGEDAGVSEAVQAILEAVKTGGDVALRALCQRFDTVPAQWIFPAAQLEEAWRSLHTTDAELAAALQEAADHIARFADQQKAQCADFDYEMAPGLWTGQRVRAVEKAAIYAPAGRFPLISSVLMGVIPAVRAGVSEVFVLSPPLKNGRPHPHIMAAAFCAGAHFLCALGGAQALAAAAFGTETIPRADLIAGPGNKYVACAKRLLFGQVGIDFVAGPTDLLIIADDKAPVQITAADMAAQAEHDPDARARALVESGEYAAKLALELQQQALAFPSAQASLDAGGLIIVYDTPDSACRIANTIAPEHLALHLRDAEQWVPALHNYGSLFIGTAAAQALGDYSAGINHTLPTGGTARFTGGLSVRHFLKTTTTLRCAQGSGFDSACKAAALIAQKEGLTAHAASVRLRRETEV